MASRCNYPDDKGSQTWLWNQSNSATQAADKNMHLFQQYQHEKPWSQSTPAWNQKQQFPVANDKMPQKKKNWAILRINTYSTGYTTQNRFALVSNNNMQTNESDDPTNNSKNYKPRVPKPSPIYIYGVTNFHGMMDYLA